MRLGCLRLRALLQFPLFILVNFRAVFLQFNQFRLVVCLSGEHQLCCIHYRVSQFSCQSAAIPNRLCRSTSVHDIKRVNVLVYASCSRHRRTNMSC